MRLSQYFLPTLRENPADAEVVSHKLMIRGAMLRKLTAGIYSYLPYGFAAFKKVEQIVREEMNRAGAIEMFMPEVQPAEVWIESGRWTYYGKELLRFKDRHNHEYCLAPTNEEVITDICRREIRSYRDMPVNLYHFQQKFRDEIRPRFGVMRGRQFCMKDAYSFDVDEDASAVSYRKMYEAYTAAFARMGLKFKAVEADSGAIGGSFSHEFMVLAETGEDAVVSCTACDYAANIERAEITAGAEPFGSGAGPAKPLEKIHTPEVRTIQELADFTGRDAKEMSKIVVFTTDLGEVAAFVRGDHEVNPVKVQRAIGAEMIELAEPETVKKYTGANVGSCGPVGIKGGIKDGIMLLADLSLKNMANWITGANEDDYHYLNVNPGRDCPEPRYADIRLIQEGDPCPRCGAAVEFLRGIEVGHVFRLGTKYSAAMEAAFLDQEGQKKPVIMGCYGIGVDRTLAAAIEQNHDDNGMILTDPIAPFPAFIVPAGQDPGIAETAQALHDELEGLGLAALLDDRDLRPGAKFKDADLIGAPHRLTVGRALKDGQVEYKPRRADKPELVQVGQAARLVAEKHREGLLA